LQKYLGDDAVKGKGDCTNYKENFAFVTCEHQARLAD
jgi:hypothetical protein